METYQLKDMVKGWFIGDFEPSLLRTKDFEVAVKEYKAGDHEQNHYHKTATEFTIIVNGEAEMFNSRFGKGDIICVQPGETTGFRAITDVVTVVVKCPSVTEDKFMVNEG